MWVGVQTPVAPDAGCGFEGTEGEPLSENYLKIFYNADHEAVQKKDQDESSHRSEVNVLV